MTTDVGPAIDALAVSRRFLDALFARDADGILATLADDVIYEFPFAPAPAPRRLEGKKLVEGLVRGWLAAGVDGVAVSWLDVRAEADPERVIAEFNAC